MPSLWLTKDMVGKIMVAVFHPLNLLQPGEKREIIKKFFQIFVGAFLKGVGGFTLCDIRNPMK